jgi:hypothetical protein
MGEIYTHPETGEETEIPDGAEITYVGKGADQQIAGWSNPPGTPEGELHPDQVEGYDPHFARDSVQRRVLAYITDDDHVGRGPRNTADRLAQELDEDPNTPFVLEGFDDPATGEPVEGDDVQGYLDELVEAGLVEARDDGTYGVTEPGRIELVN